VRKNQIKTDLGGATTIDHRVAVKAAKSVVINSTSVPDAQLLLDMLGLIPAQPGYEIKVRRASGGVNNNRDREEKDRRNEKSRLKRKEKKTAAELAEIGDID
jgi:hypothetical protein